MNKLFKVLKAELKSYRLIILSTLLLTGCTHNLIISDYENKEEYIKAINHVAEDKNTRITTKDTSFTLEDIVINEDSLRGKFFWQNPPLYSYSTYAPWNESQLSIPVKDITTISVTKQTHGILKGLGLGLLAGAVYGGLFVDSGGNSISGHHPDFYIGGIMMSLAGALFGSIVGYIVGNDYVFSFDNELGREELYKDNSTRKLGLKIGQHGGFNLADRPEEGRGGVSSFNSTGEPGIAVTLYYNYLLGKNFSLNNELSFVSAASREEFQIYIQDKDLGYTHITRSSLEKIKAIEAAPLIRLNLFKGGFTPYFLIGPKFSIQFPPENSLKEKFYTDMNNQYGGNDFSISGKYKKYIWSGVVGAGLSTGKVFPCEIMLEIRYSRDITNRFEVDSSVSTPYWFIYDYKTSWNKGHIAEELVINVGVGVF